MSWFPIGYNNYINHLFSYYIFLNPFGGTSWLSQIIVIPSPPKSVGTSMEPLFSQTKLSIIIEIRK